MKRIVVLLTVVALMVATMVVMAAPAFASLNCEGGGATDDYLFCRGGEGSQGGGFGTLLYVDLLSADTVFIRGEGGGGDGSGGGSGGRCSGNLVRDDIVCRGGGSS